MTLDEVLREALDLLRDGVDGRDSPYRTLALATMDADGGANLRTVILRAFDPAARSLAIHTDARSAKVAQLAANPLVALHGWDAGRRLQLRLRGRATLHAGDATARAAWEALPPLGRQLYRVRQVPGTAIADPAAVSFDEVPEAMGFAAFVVVAVAFDRLESLRLTHGGQMRARFEWPAGALAASWLVP